MQTVSIDRAAEEFLANQRIAVAGVSRVAGAHSGNTVYDRLKERGYETFAVNPNSDDVQGNVCYRSLSDIPGGVSAVVIATAPKDSAAVMQDCVALGIDHVWLHRSYGMGSYSEEAERIGRAAGVRVISGGCPLMFEPCDDGPHRFMKPIFTWIGSVPRGVET